MQRVNELLALNEQVATWIVHPRSSIAKLALPFDASPDTFRGRMLFLQTLFLLLHEVAHIAAGHLRGGIPLPKGAMQALDDMLKRKFGVEVAQELVADQIALKWFMGIDRSQFFDEDHPEIRIGQREMSYAIIFLFAAFGMLDEARKKWGLAARTQSHPSPNFRLNTLLRTAQSRCGTHEMIQCSNELQKILG